MRASGSWAALLASRYISGRNSLGSRDESRRANSVACSSVHSGLRGGGELDSAIASRFNHTAPYAVKRAGFVDGGPASRQQNGNGLTTRGYETVLQTATLPLGYPA